MQSKANAAARSRETLRCLAHAHHDYELTVNGVAVTINSGVVADGVQRDLTSDRYTELDRIGQGGMGVVFRATDKKLGATVALKRLLEGRESSTGSSRVELFHQEYRTLALLAHPHVVRVEDFGVDQGVPFYTMELLEGADLYSLAPLAWREACSLVRDTCSALALLHSRRLLHRDLSPRNIKRADNGRAKLIDFGAMSPMGHARQVIGTPPFVAPEVLGGHALDARTDLYSVGATLYFALTAVWPLGTRCPPTCRRWSGCRRRSS